MLILAFLRPLMPFDAGILCPLRATTGVPCPLCGMTTSVTAATHFDLPTALSANPAGIIAVLVAAYASLPAREQAEFLSYATRKDAA